MGVVCAAAEYEHPQINAIANTVIVKSLLISFLLPDQLPDYHAPLAEATKGEVLCDNTRCDPKLTLGTEIVRELPRPSSIETFTDCGEPSIGKSDARAVNSPGRTTRAGALAISRVPILLTRFAPSLRRTGPCDTGVAVVANVAPTGEPVGC
jgi:hypothetical protein